MTYRGEVIHGDGYGRTLGYPTANIAVEKPPTGVFAGTAVCDGVAYNAAIFARPDRDILEAHLLDFSGDLYGKMLTVEILAKIREVATFENDQALRSAIQADENAIRKYLESSSRV